LAKLLKFEQET